MGLELISIPCHLKWYMGKWSTVHNQMYPSLMFPRDSFNLSLTVRELISVFIICVYVSGTPGERVHWYLFCSWTGTKHFRVSSASECIWYFFREKIQVGKPTSLVFYGYWLSHPCLYFATFSCQEELIVLENIPM